MPSFLYMKNILSSYQLLHCQQLAVVLFLLCYVQDLLSY